MRSCRKSLRVVELEDLGSDDFRIHVRQVSAVRIAFLDQQQGHDFTFHHVVGRCGVEQLGDAVEYLPFTELL